jgi:plasmid stability protein
MLKCDMQEQKATKVTLYLPPDLHRQLKIRSAVDGEAMSAIAQRAIDFYLTHSEVVEGLESAYGQTHRIHSCPTCSTSVVMREGELVQLSKVATSGASEGLSVDVQDIVTDTRQPEEGELVVC